MHEAWLFDVLLILLLVSYVFFGYRIGFVGSLSALAGIAVGGVIAFFAIPLVGAWVPDPSWRAAAMLAVAVVLVLGGHSIGVTIGHRLRRKVDKAKLRLPDRLLGAALSGIVAALVASTLAFSLASLGVPYLSRAIASSAVLRVIDTAAPDPVQAFLARLRSVAVQEGLPLITEAIGGITTAPDLPNVDTASPALAEAAQSVVRVSGNASACGQSQLGSGFVVATDRIVTNAHVVAGVTEPVIETPAGQVFAGSVVYFDPIDDLAVIAVSGMPTDALDLAETAAVGSTGVVDGYPHGGPFTSGPAEVLSVDTVNVANIYGDDPAPREVYTLAANVQQGGSGGPLLTNSGDVSGVVFAKSATAQNLGYAMTMSELNPVAAGAVSFSEPVSSGTCQRG